MATDAETGTQVDAAAVWRAIGRMEGDMAALKDGQQETNRRLETGLSETNRRLETGLSETNRRLETGLSETNRRIDRVFYTILAVGGALLAAVFAARFVGD